MTHPTPSRRFAWFLVALTLFVLLFEVSRMDVWSDNEGQRATPPAEMLRYGQYVVPTINHVDYLAKPPLLYWVIAGVYKVTGVISPLTARIPIVLAATVLVLCLYLCLRKEMGEGAARWGALAFLASPYFFEHSRWAELDIPLTLHLFLAILLLRAACRAASVGRSLLFAVAGGVSLGAAILLKGPVPFLFLWAAWIAHQFETGDNRAHALRTCVTWSVVAFGVEVVLKMPVLWAVGRWAPGAAKAVAFPYALVFVFVLWSVFAWRQAHERRSRDAGLWMLALVVGVALVTPWCIAVLHAKGWPYIDRLLSGEVVERTHTATEINSGSPFYFLYALPAMLAPWGLLLPYHASRRAWQERPSVYRFSVITGWLSVLVFSLIAGKEFEYILPALPFLMIATAFTLGDIQEEDAGTIRDKWLRIWKLAIPLILLAAITGIAAYAMFSFRHYVLWIEVWALVAVGGAALERGLRSRERRLAAIVCLTLVVLLGWLTMRAHYVNEHHSPRTLAQLSGELVRRGYDVEAAKVPPAFSFYAQAEIPTQVDADAIVNKLKGDKPYFYVTRDKWLELMSNPEIGSASRVVAGPCTKKGFILIGNRPLPDGLAPPEIGRAE